ncbi:retrovirus-related pol polyprotein from transposon TNT 1-94 [Tanacetum coccineum]
MANLSHYGLDVLAEYVKETQQAAVQNSNSSAQQDALILSVIEQLKIQVINCTKINLENKSVNDTLTAELERYKEQVKVLKEGQNVDLKSKDNVSDSCEQSVEIDRLKQTLSEQLKEKESLMQTVTLLKNDFKKEESRNIDREIALEKKIKQLDNIVYKRDQSAQTKAQQLEPKLYDGNVIKNTSAIVIPDFEETLMLAEEIRSKMLLIQQDAMVLEKKVNTTPVDYVILILLVDPPKSRFQKNFLKSAWTYSIHSINIYALNTEVPKKVFHQMEQHRLESKIFEDNAYVNVHECKTCLKLETELLNKKDFIEKETYDKLSKVTQLLKTLISENEKDLFITTLKNELRKHKGKDLANNVATKHTIALEMLKVDVEPISPKLLNNRTTHYDYLRHTQEQAAILREVVEQGKSQNPLNNSLDSAYKYTKRIQELLIIIRQTCPSIHRVKPSTSASGSQPSGNINKDKIQQTPSSTQKNKVEAHSRTVKSSLKNKNCIVEPNRTTNVQHSKLNANSELLCVKCNGCMLYDNHDFCVLNFINDVNGRVKSKSVKKSSKRKVWKPIGKVFTNIRYTWRPIGRTLTIVGNACPLTRITIPTKYPPRKPTALKNDTPKPVVTLVYLRKPRKSKTNVPILGYGDYLIGNIMISRVYYVEGLGHNLFFVGQFCDSNLEVAFRQHTCFIRNLEGVDLLTGSQRNNMYTLSLGDMMASFHICLLSKASKTKSWLRHRRLSHLNFGAVNHLARHGLVRGLPKLKFKKDHLCSACGMGESKKKPYKPKSEDTNQEKLYLLHMDLCGPMRVTSVNGKKNILVIVDDYSRFTWVKCLRSKDEAPNFIIKFLKMIQLWLKALVRRIRTYNGNEFVNKTLREYYEKVGISHETCVARSPQQNGIVERRNRTLIEVACTMLIYAKAHALCYPTNNSKNLGKLQPKADIGIFIGYTPTKKAFRIYNQCTKRVIKTIHVDFDELTAIASEHSSLERALHEMTHVTITPKVIAPIAEVVALEPVASTGSPSSTTVDQDTPSPSNSQTTPETQSPVISNDVEEENHDLDVVHMNNDPFFGILIPENDPKASSSLDVIPTIVHTTAPNSEHVTKWTKDHPLDNIIGELERPVSTRLQLHEQALFCYYDAFLTSVEPKTYKDALTQPCWIEAMQEELNEFERLEV